MPPERPPVLVREKSGSRQAHFDIANELGWQYPIDLLLQGGTTKANREAKKAFLGDSTS